MRRWMECSEGFGLTALTFRRARRADVPAVLALLRDDALGALRETGNEASYLAAFDAMEAEAANHLIVGVDAAGRVVATYQLTFISGLSLRATGDNGQMITSFGVSTDFTKTLTLALSNGFVGMCGALVGQYQGFADISMGIGLILVGLASVILGQAVLGQRMLWLAVFAVIVGAVIYRIIIFLALQVGLDPNDMKLITALLVIVALLVPRWKGLTSRVSRRPAAAAGAKVPAGKAV